MGKLRDAPVGARFIDPDGDTWTRAETGAVVEFVGPRSSGSPAHWTETELDGAESRFGPMVEIPNE